MATPRSDNREQINKASDDAAHVARTVADEAGRVGEQTARAGADMARRGAETARDAMQSGVDMATQGFQRMADQIARSFGVPGPQTEELARRSSENTQAVSKASTILARGAQDVSREWVGLVQDGWRRNMEGMNRLARCQSLQDFVAIHSELMRDGVQHVIDTNKRVAELSVRISEEAAGVIQAQTNANADRLRRAAH
jgi:phasin family protein